MKVIKYLCFFLFFLAISDLSANNILQGKIIWHKSISSKVDEFTTKQFFNFDNVQYDESKDYLGFISQQIKLNNEEVINVTINNIVYQNISKDSIKNIAGFSFIGNTINLKFANGLNKKVNYGIISFIPIIYNTLSGTYKRVVSYSFNIITTRKKIINSNTQKSNTTSSVLETGDWYKIGVVKNGVFKITYSFLKNLGLDINNIDPNNIKIYGNGGKMLPEKNSVFRYDDLQQNAIYVAGASDGKFDKSDYILFYGQDPDSWTYNSTTGRFNHTKNRYSDTTYYFITASNTGQIPKRISTQNSLTSPNTTVSSFNDYAYYEKDLENLIKSGDMWLGEKFDIKTSYNFVFNFPNIDLSIPVFTHVSVVARASTNSLFTVNIGSNNMTLPIASVNTASFEAKYANLAADSMSFNALSDIITLNITYNKPNISAIGWLDEIELNARRKLIMAGNQLFFRDMNAVGIGNISQFKLSNATDIKRIWDITDPINIKEQSYNLSNGLLTFNASTNTLKQFVALTNTYESQIFPKGHVDNQNLHGITQADMIIVSHPDFLTQAAQIADFHSNQGLNVKIVTPQQIYNEFSSGSQDIVAIRDFVRMLYDRATTANALPKYLLLFGDGSYDNKNRIVGNTNFIPTYESPNSVDIIGSLVSDDFYGLLDSNEGSWASTAELLDIGIGRFPVKNQEEANNVVNKVLTYNTPISMHDWRNLITFVGDDEDNNVHMTQANLLAKEVETNQPAFNVDKIFFDAFKQESTPGGPRYPDVNAKINKAVDDGTLMLNYTGHGGEVGWAVERVLALSDINSWTNTKSYPLVITATCEFSRWDDPERTSAGELVLINKGGGIALFTTVRLTFSSPNFQLNKTIYTTAFNKINNEYQTMGEIFRTIKNLNAGNKNNRNFTLLGDPALKLAFPRYNVATTLFNGAPISSSSDTIKALSQVTITGVVQDQNGVKLSNFNGVIYPTVFDKPKQITTLQNDGGAAFFFNLQTSKLFKGKVSVQNGDFSFSFVVPKDIAFNYGKGKISYYAENQVDDANGYFSNFYIGGTADSVVADVQGPTLNLFMNDDNFVFGGITDENPILFAKISDTHGINMVGNGIGHDIVAVLDGKTDQSFILNDFYEANLNSYQKGTIHFPFKDLAEGRHTLSLKVWDVYNNSSEATIEFVVVKDKNIQLSRVYNYPNPFTTHTEFWFEHNQPGKQMHVQVQIFTISGKLVKTIEKDVLNEGYRSTSITWDGLDKYGDRIAKGVYVYKLKVRAENFSTAEKYEKLVIL